MASRSETRAAISALLDAGKTAKEVVAALQCGKSVVYEVKKRKAAGKGPQASPRKRKSTTLTPTVVAGLRRRIKAAPTKSLRQVSRESAVPRELVRKVVRESGWQSLRKVKIPLISEEGRRRRESRSAGLLNKLKSGAPGRVLFFSDEKTFVVDPSYNAQNDRWIRFDLDDPVPAGKYLPRSKHPSGAMLLGAVASTGEKSPPISVSYTHLTLPTTPYV